MKKINVLLLMVIAIMIWTCDNQVPPPGDDPPPPTTNYSINFFNPPNEYDVKNDKLFQIHVNPNLNGEIGDYRLYFEIIYNGDVLGRSNYVYFDHNNNNIQILEWGGGEDINFGSTFNYGFCDIRAYLERYNIFPNPSGTLQDWAVKDGSNQIKFFHFDTNSITRTIEVEYDEQTNQLLRALMNEALIKGAFDPCLIRFVFFDENEYGYNTGLNAELVPDNFDGIREYMMNNKDVLNRFYLGAVAGFFDPETNDPIPNRAGNTIRTDQDLNYYGSLVSVELFTSSKSPPYMNAVDDKYWEKLMTYIVIHEFGHQLGLSVNNGAHDQHDGNQYCVMYSGDLIDSGTTAFHGRSTYENPHFGIKHINEILNF